MSWLYAKRPPLLYQGETIEWDTKAVTADDNGIYGYLFLTTRRVIYKSSGTRKSLQREIEFQRSDCRSIERDHSNLGVSSASAVWQQVVFHLADNTSVRLAMREADKKINFLAAQLVPA